jgi:hypothetical protein
MARARETVTEKITLHQGRRWVIPLAVDKPRPTLGSAQAAPVSSLFLCPEAHLQCSSYSFQRLLLCLLPHVTILYITEGNLSAWEDLNVHRNLELNSCSQCGEGALALFSSRFKH